MLPTIRSDEYLYEIPKFYLDKGDVKDFMNELVSIHKSPILFFSALQNSYSQIRWP